MKNIVTKFTALALVLTATAAITAPARALSVSLPGLSAAAWAASQLRSPMLASDQFIPA